MPTQIATDIEETLFPEFPLIPQYSPQDGIDAIVLCAGDDRVVSLWSHYHAERTTQMLRESRARVKLFSWQAADVASRGNPALVAQAEALLADAKADLAEWEHRRDLLEAARRTDSYAPKSWNWE
jgi:hypothetical protein